MDITGHILDTVDDAASIGDRTTLGDLMTSRDNCYSILRLMELGTSSYVKQLKSCQAMDSLVRANGGK